MMRWIGYFFLGILLLLILIICIRFKAELNITKEEQWLEIRYLLFKYRIDLKKIFEEKLNINKFKNMMTADVQYENQKAETVHEKEEKKDVDEIQANKDVLKKETKLINEKSKEQKELPQLENPQTIEVEVSKKKSMLKAPKASTLKGPKTKELKFKIPGMKTFYIKIPKLKRPKLKKWLKAPKVKNINFMTKININYLRKQYYRFKTIYKEAKQILFRLLAKIRIHRLESALHFNVDDPALNAYLIAGFWAIEANIYRWLRKYFKKVNHHKFDVKSQFSGNDIFLEMSCIVSLRIVDIIIVVLFSLKEIFTIKRMLTTEKEV